MPEMDGFALVEQINRHPELAGATLMMISSAGRREDAQRCRELGVSAYMTKPIRRAELMDSILQALSLKELGARSDSAGRCRRLPATLGEATAYPLGRGQFGQSEAGGPLAGKARALGHGRRQRARSIGGIGEGVV